jgi:hypothetical protein
LIQATTERYRKHGLWLASAVVAGLRESQYLADARRAPYPRLAAVLNATEQAATEYDDEDYWFMTSPSAPRTRLDDTPRAFTVRRRPEPVESAARRYAMAYGHSRLNPAESHRWGQLSRETGQASAHGGSAQLRIP